MKRCRNCNNLNQDGAKFCNYCGAEFSEENQQEAASWYYAQGESYVGPFQKSYIENLIETGNLAGDDYIWKQGWPDWVEIKNSELAYALPSINKENIFDNSYGYGQEVNDSNEGHASVPEYYESSSDYGYSSSHSSYGYSYTPSPIQKRSSLLMVLLVVCTCSIANAIWMGMLADDLNKLCLQNNKPMQFSPVLVAILDVITCHLYGIYFYYRAGKIISELRYPNYRPSDDSVLLCIISIFIPVVSSALLQNNINNIIDNINYLAKSH